MSRCGRVDVYSRSIYLLSTVPMSSKTKRYPASGLFLIQLSTIYNSVMDILGFGISFVEKYIQLKGEVLPTKKTQRRHVRSGSISDDEETETPRQESATDEEFVDYVRYLDDRFLRAVPFIRSGLKASVRAADFPSLGILAASLEAGIR